MNIPNAPDESKAIVVTIPDEYADLRVDVVLAKLFPQWSRVQISQWIKMGVFTINHKIYKAKDKVYGQECVEWTPPEKNPEHSIPVLKNSSLILDICFEDEDLLVVNKPPGLTVHPGAGTSAPTLMDGLIDYSPQLSELPRAGLIHRLDKDTTGLLVVAKTPLSYHVLAKMMQAREIQRHYLALVHGHLISGGKIETFYGRHPKQRTKMAILSHGKLAITLYTLAKQYQHSTLLNIQLMTGRTHQIRVHMNHIKHPIIGDKVYGGNKRFPPGIDEDLRLALQEFGRQALHAQDINLLHPITGEELNVHCNPPDDFQKLIHLIEQKNV